jgi:hypothetical protein
MLRQSKMYWCWMDDDHCSWPSSDRGATLRETVRSFQSNNPSFFDDDGRIPSRKYSLTRVQSAGVAVAIGTKYPKLGGFWKMDQRAMIAGNRLLVRPPTHLQEERPIGHSYLRMPNTQSLADLEGISRIQIDRRDLPKDLGEVQSYKSSAFAGRSHSSARVFGTGPPRSLPCCTRSLWQIIVWEESPDVYVDYFPARPLNESLGRCSTVP